MMSEAACVPTRLVAHPLLLTALALACAAGCGTGSGTTGGSGGSNAGSGGAGTGGAGGRTGSGGSASTGGASGSGGAPASGSGGTIDAGSDGKTDGASSEVPGTGGSGMTLAGNGCAGGTCQNPNCMALGTPAAIGTYPEIGFELRPTYIPNNMIIPTFDDAPDPAHVAADGVAFTNFGAGNWTRKMIDYFDASGLHVDFFINTNNFCDLATNADCLVTLASILKNHNPANHSIHHSHMGGDTVFDPADYAASSCGFTAGSRIVCDDEIKGVETVVNMVSNGGRPHLTRFRAPYGEPFQAGTPRLAEMRALVSKYALHIGWQMDSLDSNCDDCKYTGAAIAGNVERLMGNAPGAGQWGVVLMHGTYPWSYDAAKLLLDPTTGYVQTHGFKVATVEDAVCWKYGKHSWEIVQQLAGQKRDPN